MKNNKKYAKDKIEQDVLKVYKKVNPSLYKIDNDIALYSDFERQRLSTLKNSGIYHYLVRAKNIINIGGGTGEKALIDAKINKASMKIIDNNQIALDRAKKLFKKHKLDLKTECKTLFDLKAKDMTGYDIVFCEAVLHHTYNPLRALDHLCSIIPSGAIVLIATSETNGWYQRSLQRDFIINNSTNNEDIIKIAKKYFPDHIRRAKKYGLRSTNQIIYDSFVNPQDQPIDIEKILLTFKKYRFDFIQSFPSIASPFHKEPINQEEIDNLNIKKYKKYLAFLKILWRTGYHKNFDFFDVKEIKKIKAHDKKLALLRSDIDSRKKKVRNLSLIQKGSMGYGVSYFTVCKN